MFSIVSNVDGRVDVGLVHSVGYGIFGGILLRFIT
jgi:hypothetical protein